MAYINLVALKLKGNLEVTWQNADLTLNFIKVSEPMTAIPILERGYSAPPRPLSDQL